jgi:hemolysin III
MSSSVPVELGPASLEKPLLRGVSHQVAAVVAFLSSFVLVWRADGVAASVAAAVFGACLVIQLGTSALYHRVHWGELGRMWMRRFDHSAIFLMIAGGYTPLLTVVPGAQGSYAALYGVWAGAVLGVVKSLFWAHAPKWITAALCVGLGWALAGPVIDRASVVGWLAIGLVVASGIVYSLGAAVYALKRPNPFPRVFGYHEVFHAFVVAASVLLFVHVAMITS